MMRGGLLSRSATHHVSVYLGGYVDMRIACKLGGVYTQVRPVSLMPSTVPPLVHTIALSVPTLRNQERTCLVYQDGDDPRLARAPGPNRRTLVVSDAQGYCAR